MDNQQATTQSQRTQQSPQVRTENLASTDSPDSDVMPIEAGRTDGEPTFRAVYTKLSKDIEVNLVERVSATESEYKFGHAVIDRPEWDNTKTALLQNVRVDVLEEGEDGFKEVSDDE